MADKTIHEKLVAIQSELKAPKSQTNTFGKYKYRSCEDILEAVKPLLKEQNLVLTISDEIVEVGGRVYVKATAKLSEMDMHILVTAFARESLDKKGMDDAQITGSASSYARKYALNGLFLIDDTKDADTMDNRKTEVAKTVLHPIAATQDQLTKIGTLLRETKSDRVALYKYFNLSPESVLTQEIAVKMIAVMEKKLSSMLDASAIADTFKPDSPSSL